MEKKTKKTEEDGKKEDSIFSQEGKEDEDDDTSHLSDKRCHNLSPFPRRNKNNPFFTWSDR